jgi:hypothetical protein
MILTFLQWYGPIGLRDKALDLTMQALIFLRSALGDVLIRLFE